ncbi:hypothetical protein B566_EDAN002066 [Ephemera danica]|nr:hypothetical protein B566_EDAN002066 [Ephemera danica]
MDIAAFADEDFDEKEWINKIFKTPEAQENKDDASEKVLQSLPRVVRDTELLHQEALMLRDKMQAVKAEIAKAEQDTGQSMAALEQVDRVKAELQAARQALREADNWTILATDIEEKFEQADLNGTVTSLLSMQQSLRILAHVPDFEDKCLQLEGLKNRLEAKASPLIVQAFTSGDVGLKNRLEAKASPLIVQAFTSGDVEQSKMFVNIFTGIERLPELLKYHHKCQEKALLQRWRDIAELDTDESAVECSCLALPDPLASLTDLRQVTKQAAATLQAAVESLAQAGDQPDPDMSQLNNIGGEEVADRVQSLGQTATRVVDLASNALTRCSKLTELCGVAGLIEALEEYVKGYSTKFRAVLEELSQQKRDLVSEVTEVQETIASSLRELNSKLEDCGGNSPFQQHDELLLTPDGRAKLKELLADAQHEGLGCLEKLLSNCKQLCSDAQRTAAVVIFAPIANHLLAVQTSEAWTKNMPENLPHFCYNPQEYITEVRGIL